MGLFPGHPYVALKLSVLFLITLSLGLRLPLLRHCQLPAAVAGDRFLDRLHDPECRPVNPARLEGRQGLSRPVNIFIRDPGREHALESGAGTLPILIGQPGITASG